ncbi:DUF2752 domain-containing protein [Streptomyces hainanensis]|uniref:DUF2752 domain-containing protein n=1 Tax=Streptomyces hainanensis TaxID=402648 RepID=A0A4R4TBB0_9ACTN|nr:DUF2752 domain-containing protein [Streptomyces hainanensis]TDC74500.1 DUF2752 domain-containing protein [Streptomyces hainanensis]
MPSLLRREAVPPLAVLAGGLAGAGYLLVADPHEGGGPPLPRCPVNWATGLLCPACGGTRMAYDLLHGDLVGAVHDNAALLLLGVPLAGWLTGRWLLDGLRGRRYRPRFGPWGVATVLGVAGAWTLLRNLVG